MTDDELEQARAWAETAEPYPVKRGFLTLLDEVEHLRRIQVRAQLIANGDPDEAHRRAARIILDVNSEG